MTTPLIESIIRRISRNRLLFGLACVVGLVIAGGFAFNYLVGFFTGPVKMTGAELLALESLDGLRNYYIDFTGDDSFDTGYEYVSTSESGVETVQYSYPALMVGESILLVKSPGRLVGTPSRTYTGALVPVPSDVQAEVIGALEREFAELRGAFLPYMLDATDYRIGGYIGLAVGAAVGLLALFLIVTGLRAMTNPATHAIMKRLGRYGPAQNIGMQIEMEMKGQHTTLQNKLHFLRSWLVQTNRSSFDAARFDDMTWFYKHITKNKTYGITVAKTFAAHVWDKHGTMITITARKEQQIDEILNALYARAPWAVAGYSNEINKMWRKDRPSFVAAVGQRRAQIQAQGSPQQG